MATSTEEITPLYFGSFATIKVKEYIRKSGYEGEIRIFSCRYNGYDEYTILTNVSEQLYKVVRDIYRDEFRLIVNDDITIL